MEFSICGRAPVAGILAAVGLAGALPGQVRGPDIDRQRAREAQRCVTFLELPSRRRAAAQRLLRLGPAAVPAVTRALRDPRREVVCRAVEILRMLGHHARPARAELLRLGKSADPMLRHASAWGVQGLLDLGILQVVETKADVAIEFDLAGKELRKVELGAGVYDADRLANGNYLVCDLSAGVVREIDGKGKAVWEFDGCKKPLDADRLVNGNTLIAGGNTKRVLEVDPAGEVVWEWGGTGWPNDADRLPSGNTLVADSPAKRIYEVDPAGRVVWSHACPDGVIDVQRLTNGDTMFVRAYRRGVVVVDPAGQVVWEHKEGSPRAAIRDSRGFTTVGGRGLVRLDPQGKVLWEKPGLGELNAIHRY